MLESTGFHQALIDSGNWVQDAPQGDFLTNAMRVDALDAAVVYRSNAHPWQQDLELITVDLPDAIAHQPAAVSLNSDFPQLTRRLLDRIRSTKSSERFEDLGFRWLADDELTLPESGSQSFD